MTYDCQRLLIDINRFFYRRIVVQCKKIRYTKQKKGDWMKWKRVYVEITNQCNLNCSFCVHNQRAPRFMSVTEFEHVIKEIKPYCSYVYLHVLGEPLLHPQLEMLLTICKQYNMQVHITTNGTLLKKQKELLKKLPPRQINVSLHSFPHQKDTLSYVEEVMDVCDELCSNTYISYRFWNLKDRKMDQQSQMVLGLLEQHYHVEIKEEQFLKRRANLWKQIFLNFDDIFEWPSLKHSFVSKKGTCLGGETMIGVLSDGRVVPCCLDSAGDVCFGNLLKEHLEDIIHKERFLRMLEAQQKRELNEILCQRCQYRTRFEKGM